MKFFRMVGADLLIELGLCVSKKDSIGEDKHGCPGHFNVGCAVYIGGDQHHSEFKEKKRGGHAARVGKQVGLDGNIVRKVRSHDTRGVRPQP